MTNKKGTETGGKSEEEGEGEEGEGGEKVERIGKEKGMSERERRRITTLIAHTRPWLDPHYGK